jgi:hypothetical protein
LGAFSGLLVLIFIAISLNLTSVEENLSSAYRLGNTLSFAQHAVSNDWLLGNGFGSAHFLYPNLNHPAFLYLSWEFQSMLQGEGFRVPVFNLWVRMFVELGIVTTLFILYWISRSLRSRTVLPQVKILLVSSMVFGLSADSYIYGLFTFSLFLALCVVNVKEGSASLGHHRVLARPLPGVSASVEARA